MTGSGSGEAYSLTGTGTGAGLAMENATAHYITRIDFISVSDKAKLTSILLM